MLKGKSRNRILPFAFCLLPFALFFSCQSPPTDLRTLAPADTLVYLETKNLRKTLDALTESDAFQALAESEPDFSALENVQVGVAVTGFETSEKRLTDENSVLNLKPRFVAVADTHAWQWQTRSFAENQLGDFVKKNYGGEAELKISDRDGGKWLEWTAKDERKVFAFVENSRIFFGNDRAAVEKCLAVRRGEADSLLKNESFNRAYAQSAENALAFGYVSTEGIAQAANLAGVSVAVDATESEQGKSFIARIVPQILRNTTREIVWTSQKSGRKIEDKISVFLTAETASVVGEILTTAAREKPTNAAEFLPENIFSATRYDLKNPRVAWRGLVILSAKNTDSASGNLIIQFSASLFEPYGISDAETFLSAIDSDILTARFDAEGEKTIAIAAIKDREKIKQSLSKEFNLKAPPENQFGAEIWKTADGSLSAAFIGDKLLLGDSPSVLLSLETKQSGQSFVKNANFQKFNESRAAAVTFGRDVDSAAKIVEVLGEAKNENRRAITSYLTETRIIEKGFERRTISEFGLIGEILEQIK